MVHNVLLVSILFLVLIAFIFLFILFYLTVNRRKSTQRHKLLDFYGEVISNICICESTEELAGLLTNSDLITKNNWKKNKLTRQLFIKELHKAQQSLSGHATQNLVWVYEFLGLTEDTLSLLRSTKWHRKVTAIQQLAAFKQAKHITKVYRVTNHKNQYIRDASQIAIVQLTGFEGLRFLKLVTQPLSQWQQLLLLQHLEGEDMQADKLKEWILSQNETVVEFILRLIEKFRLYDCMDCVYPLLDHQSKAVRLQALKVMKEMGDESVVTLLEGKIPDQDLEEQEIILDIIGVHSSERHGQLITIVKEQKYA
jgi:hypothetical protein